MIFAVPRGRGTHVLTDSPRRQQGGDLLFAADAVSRGLRVLHGLLVMAHVVSAVHQTNAGQTKVCQLHVPIAGNEQVVWFQVPVDDALHSFSNAIGTLMND